MCCNAGYIDEATQYHKMLQFQKTKAFKRGKIFEAEQHVPQPCILFMDSLGIHNAAQVANKLRSCVDSGRLRRPRHRASHPRLRLQVPLGRVEEVEAGEQGGVHRGKHAAGEVQGARAAQRMCCASLRRLTCA